MKKHILFFVFIFCSSFSKAQIVGIANINSETKNSLTVFSNSEIGTNTLPSSIAKKYYNNGFIEDSDKGFIKSDTSFMPRLGFDVNYGFDFFITPDSILKKKNGFTYNLHFEQSNLLSAITTNDVLESVFIGNSRFVNDGSKLNMSPTSLFRLKFQKVGIGAAYCFNNDSSSTTVFARASFVNAQKYNELVVHSSKLSFDDSTYITTGNIDFLYEHASNTNHYFASSGKGFALDFGVKYKSSNTILNVEVTNIGAVFFNNNSMLKVDTSFIFKGYNLDMNRLLNDTNYVLSTDSIIDLKKYKNTQNSKSVLPYAIRVNAQTSFFNNKLISIVDICFRNLNAFYPRILACEMYNINNKNKAGLFVANGGFTTWQYGLNYNLNLSKIALQMQWLNPHSIFASKALAVGGFAIAVNYKLK